MNKLKYIILCVLLLLCSCNLVKVEKTLMILNKYIDTYIYYDGIIPKRYEVTNYYLLLDSYGEYKVSRSDYYTYNVGDMYKATIYVRRDE